MSKLADKTAIVTGASGGIGRAAAIQLAKEGAHIVIQFNSNRHEAEKVAKEITTLGRQALLAQVNFTDLKGAPRQVEQMVDSAIDRWGSVHLLANLAGYPAKGEWNKTFLELSPDDFFKPIHVDLFGSFLCSRTVAPHFLSQKHGVIVNVSSTPALSGHNKGFAFTVAKAGIIGLTKALAVELAPYVRVNTIALGNIETEWIKELTEEELSSEREENLIKRFGTVEEVAKVITYLCSDDSAFINGQTLVLDGGNVLH